MAITLTDFDQIWASTSPLTPYSFSQSNYEEGWNFVGSTPPSRQMWDGYFKWNDEKQQYIVQNFLPLAGGTMTGNITGGHLFSIYNSADDDSTRVFGSSAWNKGAGLDLRGKDYVGDNGAFSIYAHDGTNEKRLIGKPDGTLTWDGQSIPERSYGISLTSQAGENTYTFSINTNGAVIFAKRGSVCSCHMVDYWTSGSVKIFSTSTDPITITKSANSASVTITNAYSSAVTMKILNGGSL